MFAEKEPSRQAIIIHNLSHLPVVYVTDDATAISAVENLRQSSLLALDIETTPKTQLPKAFQSWDNKRKALNPKTADIRLMQFYDGGSTVYVFDLFRISLTTLSPLFDIPLVAHPASFEGKFLRHNGINPPILHCTMRLAKARNPREFSLAAVSRLYLDVELDKTFQTSDWSASLTEDQVRYAAIDAYVTFHIYQLLASSDPENAIQSESLK